MRHLEHKQVMETDTSGILGIPKIVLKVNLGSTNLTGWPREKVSYWITNILDNNTERAVEYLSLRTCILAAVMIFPVLTHCAK